MKQAHALIGPVRLVSAAANRNLCLLPLVVCLELCYDVCCVAHHVASDTKSKHEKKGSKVDEYERERHACIHAHYRHTARRITTGLLSSSLVCQGAVWILSERRPSSPQLIHLGIP